MFSNTAEELQHGYEEQLGRANRAEAERDHYRQHIEWTIETLERGATDEIGPCVTRLRDSLGAFS